MRTLGGHWWLSMAALGKSNSENFFYSQLRGEWSTYTIRITVLFANTNANVRSPTRRIQMGVALSSTKLSHTIPCILLVLILSKKQTVFFPSFSLSFISYGEMLLISRNTPVNAHIEESILQTFSEN